MTNEEIERNVEFIVNEYGGQRKFAFVPRASGFGSLFDVREHGAVAKARGQIPGRIAFITGGSFARRI